jgi:protein tyrosine/serine phosphatase
MSSLIDLGVQTVINLEWLHDDRETFDRAKVSNESRLEVQYFRIPDWEPFVVLAPQKVDDHVVRFMAITRTQPKPIFVHCRSGKNRTGVMVAAYRVFNGASIEEAIAEMKRYGGEWFKYDADYIRTLTPQRLELLEKRIVELSPKLQPTSQVVCANGACNAVSN